MHVVLLGYRAEAVEELRALGHRITLLYVPAHRRAVRERAGQFAHQAVVPSYDVPELAWSALLHLGVSSEVDVVIPTHELGVVTASILNDLLGCRNRIAVHTAMAGRDKALQKSLWTKHGVPTARFATFTETPSSLEEVESALGDLKGPFVVKPPSLGGSRFVTQCATVADVYEAVLGEPELRRAVVEEKQVGHEWELDGVVLDGRVENLLAARYLAPMIETLGGAAPGAVAYPVARHPELYAEVRRFAQAAVDALGGRWGVFHLEVFGEPGHFTAGELAWRPPGDFCPLLMEHTVGVETWPSHVRVLAGAELEPPRPVSGLAVGRVGLPLVRGAKNGVTLEDVLAMPGVCHAKMSVQPGEVMGGINHSHSAVAWALIQGTDVEDCERLLHEAVRRTDALHAAKSIRA